MKRILTQKAWAAIKAIVPLQNLYPLDNRLYGLDRGGSIRLRATKPMSRRDKIRAGIQSKNRFIETKETAHV